MPHYQLVTPDGEPLGAADYSPGTGAAATWPWAARVFADISWRRFRRAPKTPRKNAEGDRRSRRLAGVADAKTSEAAADAGSAPTGCAGSKPADRLLLWWASVLGRGLGRASVDIHPSHHRSGAWGLGRDIEEQGQLIARPRRCRSQVCRL